MKITKTSDRAAFLKISEQIANKNCDKCPCCGVPYYGIPTIRTWYKSSLFKKGKNMKIKCYSCYWCGAEWESEPYEWT